ncbi:MAG: AmmeMemoRadiSam system protein B [Deltaproteobacteria bacterium]|nr:AmmeMemoRadiSam system protein B [Deltaproteobacteria bacterium]
MSIRQPAVAGQFYSADPDRLKKDLASMIFEAPRKIHAKGIVVPHAGYVYSGKVAGQVYSQVEIPNRLIILSPNHTGLGVPFSIMNRGVWRLPLGDAKIDEELADKLMKEFGYLEVDTMAHAREHSLEVQIPFIQFLKMTPSPHPPPSRGGGKGEGGFTFVPVTIGHVSYALCKEFGEAIARVVEKEKEPILIISSSDMNHYEEHYRTLEKDRWAIDEMLKRDPEGLYETVHNKDISMCGIIPTTIMLTACNQLGAIKAELVDHKTSGDVTGDLSGVVGYAGVIVS